MYTVKSSHAICFRIYCSSVPDLVLTHLGFLFCFFYCSSGFFCSSTLAFFLQIIWLDKYYLFYSQLNNNWAFVIFSLVLDYREIWYFVTKIVLVMEKNFWNSRLKAENLQKFWDHSNNLFKQWKVRTIFGNRMLF